MNEFIEQHVFVHTSGDILPQRMCDLFCLLDFFQTAFQKTCEVLFTCKGVLI